MEDIVAAILEKCSLPPGRTRPQTQAGGSRDTVLNHSTTSY